MQSTSVVTRTSASWLTLSLLAGVASHLLFWESAPGLNVLIWAGLLELCWLKLREGQRPSPQEQLLLVLAICFAVGFVWRAAPFPRLVVCTGLITCAGLMPLVGAHSHL